MKHLAREPASILCRSRREEAQTAQRSEPPHVGSYRFGKAFHARASGGFTLKELVVVIAVALLLAGFLLPMLWAAKKNVQSINCNSNLKSLGTAFRLWASDYGGTNEFYPAQVSTNFGGALEPLARGEVSRVFEVMSNEINAPKILLCPADIRQPAASLGALQNSNLSYFVGRDAYRSSPDSLVTGDRNLEVAGQQVPAGQFALTTNQPVGWTRAQHRRGGNVGLADGSVRELSNPGLRAYLVEQGLATNRLVIP